MSRVIQASINLQPLLCRRLLVVGLVNNTSNRALRATESQYGSLLQRACPGVEVRLRLFSCRESRGSGRLQDNTGEAYSNVDKLFGTRLDAVIVTGMEPQAAKLQDEPVWNSLTKIVDWAQDKTVPVLWSCLAAHAVVLYLDGIARSRLPSKLSSVFDCDVVSVGHPLSAGLPSCWKNQHSRYHDVPEAALIAGGYQILSRSREAGADVFLKLGTSPFIFFQGHPEFNAGTLFSEYVRDVRRYLTGERDEYPLVPRHYMDATTAAALALRRDQVLQGQRDPNDLTETLRLLAGASPLNPWHLPAIRFFANWLACIVSDSLRSLHMEQMSGCNGHRQPDLAVAGEC